MKKLFTLLVLTLLLTSVNAQTNLPVSDNFGTPTTTTAFSAYTASPIGTISGNGDLRGTVPSTGYAGASGGGNVFLTNTAAGRNITYSNFQASGTCPTIDLSFGILKSATSANGASLVIEYSLDNGATWIPVTFTVLLTGAGTTGWYLRSITGLPNNINGLRFTNSTTATQFRLDDITLTGVGCVLPVQLTNFSISKSNLTFSTASESNNSHFMIERSANGTDFREIGTVKGAGYSNNVRNYIFSDATPLKGFNYYRLKQVDFDGRFEYSKIVSSYVGNKVFEATVVSAQSDLLRLNVFSQISDEASISVYDMNGRMITTQNVTLVENDNEVSLSSNLQSGVYVIKIATSNGEQISKMLNIR